MITAEKYLEIDNDSWNTRPATYLNSNSPEREVFLQGSSLNEIELNLLGSLTGKNVLHLSCCCGQDTLSLSRLGAQVTGVDTCEMAINQARLLAKKTAGKANFICTDWHNLLQHLTQRFDVIFTSYGTISRLPDLGKWAEIISQLLKPGGQLVLVEFHPIIGMFNESFNNIISYNYFNTSAFTPSENTSYANRINPNSQESVSWNHSISEVLNSLLKNGLEINSFDEFDYSPYYCFKETIEVEPRKYRIKHLDNKIPMVYAVSATKKE